MKEHINMEIITNSNSELLDIKYSIPPLLSLFPSKEYSITSEVDNRNWKPEIPISLSYYIPKISIELNFFPPGNHLSEARIFIKFGGMHFSADFNSVTLGACNADPNSEECLNYSLRINRYGDSDDSNDYFSMEIPLDRLTFEFLSSQKEWEGKVEYDYDHN